MGPVEAAKIITGIVVDDYLSDNRSRRFSAVLDSHLEDLVNLALVACGHNSRKDAPFSSFYVLADGGVSSKKLRVSDIITAGAIGKATTCFGQLCASQNIDSSQIVDYSMDVYDLVTKNAHYVGNWQFFDPGTTETYLRETFKLMKARLGDDE